MKQVLITIACWIASLFAASAQFTLPSLAYKYNALEPFVDSTTMYIHLNNHHATYVANVNKALEKYPDLKSKSIEELISKLKNLPADIQTTIQNSGGGHFNHCFFWKIMAPAGTAPMSDYVSEKLTNSFGSIDEFKAKFESASTSRFGSGWAWLIKDEKGNLQIISTPNQDNTLMDISNIKGKPLLAIDLWEHAYYLKYQSKRAAYVKAFWNIVNWTEVERLMKE